MSTFRAISVVLLLILATYNLLTIPILDDPAIIWDVSKLTYNGNRIWLLKSEKVDRTTTRYGVTTSGDNSEQVEFWLNDSEIAGELNYFFSWDTFQQGNLLVRADVMLNGFIWAATVFVFGFVLSYRDRQTYLIATKIAGLASAIGVFSMVSGKMPYRSAVVSFVPSAGWGIIMPVIGLMLDRSLDRYEIDLSLMDILEGLVDEIVLAMSGYTLLHVVNATYPIADRLPW